MQKNLYHFWSGYSAIDHGWHYADVWDEQGLGSVCQSSCSRQAAIDHKSWDKTFWFGISVLALSKLLNKYNYQLIYLLRQKWHQHVLRRQKGTALKIWYGTSVWLAKWFWNHINQTLRQEILSTFAKVNHAIPKMIGHLHAKCDQWVLLLCVPLLARYHCTPF